jgi:peptide/nickel transport system ATP-binding protein
MDIYRSASPDHTVGGLPQERPGAASHSDLLGRGVTIPLLAVEDLSVEFRTRDGVVRALENVSFSVGKGETVGVVGESGSGKSVTALAILGILHPAARVTGGRAVFGGLDLLTAGEDQLREYRGRELSMIFQNPRTALNPIRPVGRQIEDVLLRHANLPRSRVRERAIALLAEVQIGDPARAYHAYPFELSGGMCQRVMIALAVACSPALLIADEPTTGLDVTTQAAILELIEDLARRNRMAMVLITHDLALVGERCDRIVVMHAGHVVETAPTAELFASPRHPYTARLIASTPRPGVALADLRPIPGAVPDLRSALLPCRYRSRCERAIPACDEPPLPRLTVGPGHTVACRVPL